jgi:hypothetical protein
LPAPHPWSDDAALGAALALGLDRPVGIEAQRLAGSLAGSFGAATVALLHYGSHAQAGGAEAGPDSAFDFFVVVDQYLPAYRALAARLPHRFPARRAALLNRILPPNVLSVPGPEPRLVAKCCVLSVHDLDRACSAHPADHFVRARLFQQVHLVWARDTGGREVARRAVGDARWGTYGWAEPFLPERFDARRYARTLLDVSYAAEIRPEGLQHVDSLLEAQAATLLPMFDTLLAGLAARGSLRRVGDEYRRVRRPGLPARAFARAWFGWSKLRATLRWLKYVALYDDWLDYVVRKVERKSGVTMELSERERRWPLLFLWPRAMRFITRRPGAGSRRSP